MIMQVQPLYDCWKSVCDEAGRRVHTIYMSPQGKPFTQADAIRLRSDYERLILVCGHYEGVDERFIELCVDEELSLGDFVLTAARDTSGGGGRRGLRLVPECWQIQAASGRKATIPACSNTPNILGRGLQGQEGALRFAVRPPRKHKKMAPQGGS
jgi:hypothetical protein